MKNEVKTLIKAIHSEYKTAAEREYQLNMLCDTYGTEFVATCFVDLTKAGEL